jgi:hypothetical protein
VRWSVLAALVPAFVALAACRAPVGPAAGAGDATGAPGAPPFACAAASCEQRHPRLPDDGEWTCADASGATICVGGERAAGVAPAPGDPRWRCGGRRDGNPGRVPEPSREGLRSASRASSTRGGATRDALGTRVCVDAAPDLPDGARAAWRCRFVNEPPVRRVCARDDSGGWRLGAACDARRPCAAGSPCVEGRCTLPHAPPDCWLDGDCSGGACRFGRCGGPPS